MGEEDGRRSFVHSTVATRAEGEFFRGVRSLFVAPFFFFFFLFFVFSRKKNARQETFIREIIGVSMGIGGRIFLQRVFRGRKKNLLLVHMERA